MLRHYCYEQIYEKKKDNLQYFKFKEIHDEELFVDFKLNFERDNDIALFNLLTQGGAFHNGRMDEKRGDQLSTMPFFLTDEYRELLENQRK